MGIKPMFIKPMGMKTPKPGFYAVMQDLLFIIRDISSSQRVKGLIIHQIEPYAGNRHLLYAKYDISID